MWLRVWIKYLAYTCIIIIGVLFLTFSLLNFNGEEEYNLNLTASQNTRKVPLFDTCPKYTYRHDDPEILALVGESINDPLCKREPGPTYLKNGHIYKNLGYPEVKDYDCTARCAFYGSNYENKYGPECRVGVNCTTFRCDIIDVVCRGIDGNLTYFDIHTQIFEHSRDRKAVFGDRYRPGKSPKIEPKKHFYPSVHIFILDAAGRFPAFRQLNQTISYMKNEMQAVDFTAFARGGPNSRSNVFGSFMGDWEYEIDRSMYGGSTLPITITDDLCAKGLDERPYIQYEYEDAGYRTMFAQDYFLVLWGYVECAGIAAQLATHYMRPFQLLTIKEWDVWNPEPLEKVGYQYRDDALLSAHLRNWSQCGSNFQHVVDYTSKFMKSYPDQPKMSISWTAEAHDSETGHRNSDKYYLEMLRTNKKQLDDAILIVMGDHGQRFGPVASTDQGKFEMNNPLLLISLPKRLRDSKVAKMLQKNKDELMSHHDLHATFIDIIRHQAPADFGETDFRKIEGSIGNSLLRELDPNSPRSCKYQPIPSQYCICDYGQYEALNRNDTMWTVLPKMIENDAAEYLNQHELVELCDEITVANVTSISTRNNGGNATYYNVEFFTTNAAQFQVSYTSTDGNIQMAPVDFMRLNKYGSAASCLPSRLAMYKPVCYCRKQ